MAADACARALYMSYMYMFIFMYVCCRVDRMLSVVISRAMHTHVRVYSPRHTAMYTALFLHHLFAA